MAKCAVSYDSLKGDYLCLLVIETKPKENSTLIVFNRHDMTELSNCQGKKELNQLGNGSVHIVMQSTRRHIRRKIIDRILIFLPAILQLLDINN
ncbi:CLUMA_CG014743, isoform A [Clunio marinus]|uniref:CLUMA_CG014743, isoform A n=1 Tax=Clunio marinus TaxID=568069 RepID=A0A1J1IPC4_9DIPT|nr:CLUMA_CG014743, isoform A [Clunio marinus]